jgi:diguanylate cyclase (GGDEF)-like protein
MEAAGRLLAATAGARAGTVVLLDVDGMGGVNRRFGTEVGDLLLARIEAALRDAVTGRGGVACYGGDQFLAVLTGRHRSPAAARDLRRAVRAVRVGRVSVRASLGTCTWSGERPPAGVLLTAAAGSLDRAKRRR